MWLPASLLLLLALLSSANMIAQVPPTSGTTGKSATIRAKSIAGKLADTAVSSAAAMAVDTLLGDQASTVAAVVAGGTPTCPDGLVPFSVAPTAAAPPVAFMPTPGSLIVSAAKQKLSAKSTDSSTGAASSAAQWQCGTPEQAAASNPGAQAGGAPSAMAGVGAIVAATPQGMLITGAIAAAPAAGKGLKRLGGMFGRGKQSGESMAKDLAKGRLQVKGLRFVDGSDEFAADFEPTIASLAEALQAADGRFLLVLAAERNGDGQADTSVAQRRLARVAAHLQLAGVPDDRWTVIDERQGAKKSAKVPKRGDARLELVRLPPESTP